MWCILICNRTIISTRIEAPSFKQQASSSVSDSPRSLFDLYGTMNAQEAKRRRTMSAQQTKEVSTEEPIDINFRMLSGKDIGTISIAPTASGRNLMERVRALILKCS